jgi:hypothetical protein
VVLQVNKGEQRVLVYLITRDYAFVDFLEEGEPRVWARSLGCARPRVPVHLPDYIVTCLIDQ